MLFWQVLQSIMTFLNRVQEYHCTLALELLLTHCSHRLHAWHCLLPSVMYLCSQLELTLTQILNKDPVFWIAISTAQLFTVSAFNSDPVSRIGTLLLDSYQPWRATYEAKWGSCPKRHSWRHSGGIQSSSLCMFSPGPHNIPGCYSAGGCLHHNNKGHGAAWPPAS